MTSYASLRSAVDAMKLGAVDYIAKPFDHEEMLATVASILQRSASPRETDEETEAESQPSQNTITGNSAPMLELFKRLSKVAKTQATVLIQGESGTGKNSPPGQSISKAPGQCIHGLGKLRVNS